MEQKYFSRLATCIALCSVSVGASVAWAQTATTATDQAVGQTQLEEVIVTAQRFSENLEKSPLAITAITGDSLRALGVFNVADLSQVVPNLSVGKDGLGAQVGMRGVVSNNRFESGDPAVSLNVDGVYLARQRSAIIGMYDIDHIEVLRGPQGTLYGRNSVAGAINIITKKPDLTKEAAAGSIEYGNYNAVQAFGMINVPVSGTFGLRMAFQSDRHDGYSDNAPSRDYNDLDATSARLSALWNPSGNFNALLSLDYFHNGAISGGYTGGASIGVYAASSGATPYKYPVGVGYGQPFGDEKAKDVTLHMDWKLPIGTLSYVGNLRKDYWEAGATLPVQGQVVTTWTPPGVCATATDPSCNYVATNSDERQTSHELRLSNQTDMWKWQFGFYYFSEHNTLFTGIHPCPCGPDIVFVTPDAAEASHAVFGQTTFNITKTFRLTGGVRYTNDFKGRNGILYGVPAGQIIGLSCPDCAANQFFNSPNISSLRWKKTTWKVGADFDLTANSMLFASVATGYKAGGYNDGQPPNMVPFEPENILNYELGLKNDLRDHRLQINVDVFHSLYKDYQASGGAIVNGVVTGLIINAGRASIDGVELETVALLTPLDRLGFNATALNGRFTDFILPHGDGYNGFAYEDLTGNRLPGAPRTTLRIDYQHTFPLNNGGAFVTRIDSNYVAAQELEYHNFPVAHQAAYTRSGLSLAYNAPKIWSATLWVRNLEDKAVLASLEADNSVPANVIGLAGKSAFYMAPRTFGLRVAANF